MADYKSIKALLMEHFKDNDKVIQWLTTVNPLLGDQIPIQMIASGRQDKLEKFIINALDGNIA